MRRIVKETGTASLPQKQDWLEKVTGRAGAVSALGILFAALLSLWCFLLLFFHFFPGIDISVSRAFYHQLPCSPETPAGTICGYFPVARNEWLGMFREILYHLPLVLGITLLYRLVLAWSHHGATYDRALVQRLMAGVVSLLLGPVLLVNYILKEISNRPRPRNTDLLGGQLPFMPAGDFSGACRDNCSFVSGEAAGAGWLFCYAIFLLPNRFRLLLAPPLVAFSLASPMMRLAYGAHYLSDVVLGWLSSVVIFVGILYLFTRKESVGTTSYRTAD